jgi:RTX calcium-binding nonapeptide repeat (4 copies)
MLAVSAGHGAKRASLAAIALCLALAASPAEAKKFVGTKKADRLSGTAKSDVLLGKKGNDRLRGRKGDDKLRGSAGKDKLAGGKGKDSLAGGGGRDVLKARDGAADARVHGGKGRDLCVIDQADAPVVKGCERVTTDPGARPGSGSGGGGGSGGGAGSDGLVVTSSSGMTCDSSLPTCAFQIEGTGAESAVGLVTSGGGVTLAAGAGVSVEGPDWTAAGAYGCTEDGFIRVTIGEESIDVPVDCTVE